MGFASFQQDFVDLHVRRSPATAGSRAFVFVTSQHCLLLLKPLQQHRPRRSECKERVPETRCLCTVPLPKPRSRPLWSSIPQKLFLHSLCRGTQAAWPFTPGYGLPGPAPSEASFRLPLLLLLTAMPPQTLVLLPSLSPQFLPLSPLHTSFPAFYQLWFAPPFPSFSLTPPPPQFRIAGFWTPLSVHPFLGS